MTYQMWTRVEKQNPDSQICCQVMFWQSGRESSTPRTSLHAPRRLRLSGALPASACREGPQSGRCSVSALPAVTRISAGNETSLRANTQTASLGSTAPPRQDTRLPSRERQLLIPTSILPPFPGSNVVEIFLSPFPQKAILVQRLLNPSAFPRGALKHKIHFSMGVLPFFFLSR